MKTKIPLIVLVDDNPVTNFFNKRIIEENKIAQQVIAFSSAIQALEFIKPENTLLYKPSYIFLDLEMPHIDGWEFLDHYHNFTTKNKASVIILSNKKIEKDKSKNLDQYKFVKGVHNKVISNQLLASLATTENKYQTNTSISI